MTALADVREVFDTVVVGGGLSGLVLANSLPAGTSWVLLEASPRFGGRLRNSETGIDMGAAWVWPAQQPHMRELIRSLGLKTFEQPDDGSSTRVVGGAVEFAQTLVLRLDPASLRLNWAVESCTQVHLKFAPHIILCALLQLCPFGS